MQSTLSHYIILISAGWYLINGILHDIFVVRGHKTGYDKDLMRLLMDGHVLILSGILMLISWMMLHEHNLWGAIIGFVVGAGMIIYCVMIFPFLKSFFTLFISIAVALACVWLFFHYRIIQR